MAALKPFKPSALHNRQYVTNGVSSSLYPSRRPAERRSDAVGEVLTERLTADIPMCELLSPGEELA